jgi:primary-amine oxidase
MTVTTARSAEVSARHPLAPLTVEEAAAAARLALAATGEGARLVYVALAEPDKSVVLGWDGTPAPRKALAVTYAKPAGLTWMITIDLAAGAVAAKVPVPGAQPPIMIEEWMADAEGIKADPSFQAACAKRGVTDMSRVQIDPWPASYFGLDIDNSGKRLARGVAYLLDGEGGNPYAKPIENLVAIWDRDAGVMVELHDGEVIPVPQAPGR